LLQYGEEDRAEALHSQAIFASYGWLFPQACYQGINPILLAALLSWGQLSLQLKIVPGFFLGDKCSWCIGLTALPTSCADS
jgi:hypothetical protein